MTTPVTYQCSRPDHLTHQVAIDIYHSLTPQQRRDVTDAMSQHLNPLQIGGTDDEASTVQPVHATQLVAALRRQSHLTTGTATDASHHRRMAAREAKHLARTAIEPRGQHHMPPTSTGITHGP